MSYVNNRGTAGLVVAKVMCSAASVDVVTPVVCSTASVDVVVVAPVVCSAASVDVVALVVCTVAQHLLMGVSFMSVLFRLCNSYC